MTKVGEEWDYALHLSRLFDTHSWENREDPVHWASSALYWGTKTNIIAANLAMGDFSVKCTETKKKGRGRLSYYTVVQGRYTASKNVPGSCTVRIRAGTDWGWIWDSSDDPTNVFDLTLTIVPITNKAGEVIGAKAKAIGTSCTGIKWSWGTPSPTGKATINSGWTRLNRTRVNGKIKYGFNFQGGSITWTPINKKKKK